MRRIHELNQNWQFAPAENQDIPIENLTPQDWHPAKVPGTIHTDLIDFGLIPDPFYSDNEKKLQWITQGNWTYQTEFDFPSVFDESKTTNLIFKGLDTITEIYLNDELIGRTDNMFITYRFDVTKRLGKRNNKLRIQFKSPLHYGRELIEKHGELFSARWPERSYIRKAQYSFGWDWGPAYPTMGIWQPVYLEQNSGVTIEACTISTYELNEQQAKMILELELAGRVGIADHLLVELSHGSQKIETRF